MATGCATKATTKPGEGEPGPAASGNVIHEVTVNEEQTAVVVTIKSNQPLKYSAIKHLFPLGVVLYFPNTSLEGVEETYTPESILIKSIIASQPTGKKGASRIQINLKDDAQYEVNQDKNELLVNFPKPAAEKPAAEERVAEAPPETVEPTIAEAEQEPAPTPARAEAVGKPAWVNRINFLMMEKGKSRVIVRTTAKVRYETQRPSPKRVLLKLFNVKIPKFEKRPLITTRFKSAVDRVVPVQTAKMGDTALIAIELREAVPYRVEQKDNVFFVDFEPSTIPPRPLADVEMPKWQQVMRETEAAVTGVPAVPSVPSVKVVSLDTGKVYTGQKVSLDFQDADIRNVFRILHEISGKNFIIGEDVRGRVTLKLDKVPWDQVLDLVTRMNKLGIAEEGNIIRIAPHATIEAERVAEKSAKEAEQEAAPLLTEYIPINYSEASAIQQHLQEVKTERGKLTVDERTNILIMTDVMDAIRRAKEVVKQLDVATRQVMIEARIVEAETNFSREIGIQWGFTHQTLRGSDELGGPYGFSGAVGGPANLAVNLPPGAATSGIGFNFMRFPGGLTSLTIDAALTAAESEGSLKIISAPKVLTLDNKEATIKQGQQIPYQKEEEGTISVEFIDAVLSLTVMPHITMDNRVSLKVNATKDSPDFGNAVLGQPPIDTQQTTTELLVNNGDTIVIGGIITEDRSIQESKVPGLSEIPILGWLFKSRLKQFQKTELLIFITPTIVELEEVSL
jgi:type IV pilus assembly protein PilQ